MNYDEIVEVLDFMDDDDIDAEPLNQDGYG